MSSFLESCFQEHYPFYSKLTTDEQQTLVLSSVLTTYQRGDFLYSCDDPIRRAAGNYPVYHRSRRSLHAVCLLCDAGNQL